MRKIILLIFMSSCLVLSGQTMAYAFAPGDQDCSKCHTLSNEQATKTLSEMIPDIKVLNITPSAVKGLWEVSIETGGRKIIVYLDYSGKHLMAGNLFLIQDKDKSYTGEATGFNQNRYIPDPPERCPCNG